MVCVLRDILIWSPSTLLSCLLQCLCSRCCSLKEALDLLSDVLGGGGAEDEGDDLDKAMRGEDQLSGGQVVVLVHILSGKGGSLSGV